MAALLHDYLGSRPERDSCVTQSERLAKYNQLLRIERSLGAQARLAR